MSQSNRSTNHALELVNEVLRLAREHDNTALLAIEADPSTEALLSQLTDRQAGQARVHLRAARMWKAKQNRKAGDKLDAAEEAMNRLDLVLARGILRKLDSEILERQQLDRYDSLLLAVTARQMELDEISDSLPEPPPDDAKSRRRRPWRR